MKFTRLRFLKLRFCLRYEDFRNPKRQRGQINTGFSSLTRRVIKIAQLQNLRFGLVGCADGRS
jgi:hypothetical protein